VRVIVALVSSVLRDLGPRRAARGSALVGIALNPVCVILVCQHGNFDVLGRAARAARRRGAASHGRSARAVDWILACLWLGLAIALKSAPRCSSAAPGGRAPPPDARGRARRALAVGPRPTASARSTSCARETSASSSLSLDPGWFGATGWFHRLGHDEWMLPYSWAARLAILGGAVALGVSPGAAADEPRGLVAGAALLLAAVPGIGPGYGPQYFYWFWPLRPRRVRARRRVDAPRRSSSSERSRRRRISSSTRRRVPGRVPRDAVSRGRDASSASARGFVRSSRSSERRCGSRTSPHRSALAARRSAGRREPRRPSEIPAPQPA
jgi:hypothetical protein